jgi:hypothetical protein
MRKISALVATVVLMGLVQPASANAATTDLNGLTFTWPSAILAPQTTAEEDLYSANIEYKNNSGKDFYYIGYSSTEPNGTPFVAFDIKTGVKAGTSGTLKIKLKMLSFLNFTGPATYGLKFCATIALSTPETCTQGSIVITKSTNSGVVNTPNTSSGSSTTIGDAQTINVKGMVFTFLSKMYIPTQGSTAVPFKIVNGTGAQILQASIFISDSSGRKVLEASIIGLKQGATYETFKRNYATTFSSGPGTYKVTARIELYSGGGTYTELSEVTVLPWTSIVASNFPSPSQATQGSVDGVNFKWPSKILIPASGNIPVEVEVQNKAGKDILYSQFLLLDKYGNVVIDGSAIGLKSGASTIIDASTYASSFPSGAGTYRAVLLVENYSGGGSYTQEFYVEVSPMPGPPSAISKMTATRSSTGLTYIIQRPTSSHTITEYQVYLAYLVGSLDQVTMYSSYSPYSLLKSVTSETFEVSKDEISRYLSSKPVNLGNTAVMVRVVAVSSQGRSDFGPGVYSLTSLLGLSGPTVTTKPKAPTVTKQITCVKGKLTKKFVGTNPKCPSGWTKKG